MHKGTQEQISQKIQIFINGKDYMSQFGSPFIDSFLQVTVSDGHSLSKRILKTPVYLKDTSPTYTQTITMDYYFQRKQNLTFRVFVKDQIFGQLKDIPLSSLVQNYGGFCEKNLINNTGKDIGKLLICCQKINEKLLNKKFQAKVSVTGLKESSTSLFQCFGGGIKKKVLFKISRAKKYKQQQIQLILYISQSKKYDSQIQWTPFMIQQSKLCLNDELNKFCVKFFYQSDLEIQIGKAQFFLKKFQQKRVQFIKFEGKQRGKVLFSDITRHQDVSFLHLIQNGLQIKTAVCIDFTQSNGKIDNELSKHYIVNQKSAYEIIMQNILSALLQYDSEQKVTALGFGSKINHPKLNTIGNVSHCFPINMSLQNPSIRSKQAVISEYKKCLPFLDFSGPTLFQHIIKWAMCQCKKYIQKSYTQQYLILLILTDGQLCDKQKTYDLIIKCSRLPISLVVIGIGQQNFQMMNELNSSLQIQDSKGNKPIRDFIQFIQGQKYKNKKRQMRDALLAKIQKQVEEYFEKNLKQNKNKIQRMQQKQKQNQFLRPTLPR